MGPREQELLQKLLVTFKTEADEHLRAISSGLLKLESASSASDQMEMIENILREAHSLKGAARAVNQNPIEGACQSLEDTFVALKVREISLSPELFDQFHQAVDAIAAFLSSSDTKQVSGGGQARKHDMPAVPRTKNVVPPSPEIHTLPPTEIDSPRPEVSLTTPKIPAARAADGQRLSETLRVPTSKLDLLFRQAEELIPIKATAAQRAIELQDIAQILRAWETESRKLNPFTGSIEKSLDKKNGSNGHVGAHEISGSGEQKNSFKGQTSVESQLEKVGSFVDRNRSTVRSLQSKVAILGKHLDDDRRVFERRLDDLLEDAKQVSTIPFFTLLELFPKLVRDLCRDCGKNADLAIMGGEIEADRRVLEEIKDAFVHLIRNCIDHGIESPSQREKRGKPPRATIVIAISPKTTDKVEIIVSDDGAGIDLNKVRTTAIKLGIVSQEDLQEMNDQETAALIFRSGISTSPMITEVSGRGLGLAIVREKVEKVGGTVTVETMMGQGTNFRLTLPLTIARFRGTVVRVGDRLFVLPSRQIERVLRVSPEEIRNVENRQTIQVDDRPVSVVWLADVLEIPQRSASPDVKRKIPVLLLTWAGEQIAFLVDEILDEREVLVKGLGKQLPRVRNIAGATLLGTGKILPVLNVADLIQSAIRTAHAAPQSQTEEVRKSILVAEDSITARTLLKNVLEFAGYKVKTAFDGAEALNVLANEDFDLVVSDVEMPRLSGLDLTAKIRSDKRLSQLPVVLVTGLASREDQERGADAGANAYIVKSSFDQGNLLEVVRRLI